MTIPKRACKDLGERRAAAFLFRPSLGLPIISSQTRAAAESRTRQSKHVAFHHTSLQLFSSHSDFERLPLKFPGRTNTLTVSYRLHGHRELQQNSLVQNVEIQMCLSNCVYELSPRRLLPKSMHASDCPQTYYMKQPGVHGLLDSSLEASHKKLRTR